jgi:GNAT superfamily N-acetyltransferase
MSEMDVVIEQCLVGELFNDPDMGELCAEYEQECANPELGKTTPQRSLYERLEGCGAGRCFAARLEGRLRGFAFMLLADLPHYGKKCATVESLFIARVARAGQLGWRMMETIDAHAKAAGCEAIFYSAPVDSRFARLLLGTTHSLWTGYVFTKSLR